jgi:cytochrome c-type biogenesis protein CcmH/NrfG
VARDPLARRSIAQRAKIFLVVNAAKLISIFFLALFCAVYIPAKELPEFRVGEIADTDIITPVAFDMVDADATAARKISEAQKVPAIFRDFSETATNTMTAEFSAAFAAARANFLAAVQKNFRTPPLKEKTIASSSFNNFLTVFNFQNKAFPVSQKLAHEWARGNDGIEIENQLLELLEQIMNRPVCADDLPEKFFIGEKLRLIPVSQPDEKLSLDSISENNRIISATNLIAISQLRNLFRENFPPNEQSLADAMTVFLAPNCAPEIALTQSARDRTVRDLIVSNHFSAGQIIVQRGTMIDEKTKIALDKIREQLITSQKNSAEASVFGAPTVSNNSGLVVALVFVSLIAVVALFFVWRLARAPKVESQVPARIPATGNFSPQIAEVIKAALVQELAATRVELFKAQQSFSEKIISHNQHAVTNGAPPLDEPAQVVAKLISEGESRLTLNELEKALKCFDTAATLQPDDADVLVKMGGVLEKMERTDEALACYDRAIAADDSLTIAYLQKGGLFNRLARYAEATQCYEQALLKQEKNPPKNNS